MWRNSNKFAIKKIEQWAINMPGLEWNSLVICFIWHKIWWVLEQKIRLLRMKKTMYPKRWKQIVVLIPFHDYIYFKFSVESNYSEWRCWTHAKRENHISHILPKLKQKIEQKFHIPLSCHRSHEWSEDTPVITTHTHTHSHTPENSEPITFTAWLFSCERRAWTELFIQL